jgi:mevalonate kinase
VAPPTACASAAGKIILLGEHAVVYGQPAIAAPLSSLRATATVAPLPPGRPATIAAPDLGRTFLLDDSSSAAADDPLVTTVRNTLAALRVPAAAPAFRLEVSSQVPIARGMGSGAAGAAAIVRALGAYYGEPLGAEEVSSLVFQTERLLHGAPSGVDNTVIAYERPVWFAQGSAPQVLSAGAPFHWVVADTGIRAETRDVVADVQRSWQAERIRYERLFARMGDAVRAARRALSAGDAAALGRLMDENQALLGALGVSCAELDALIGAARAAGALGAKLSGGGRGGVMIALVTAATADSVEAALRRAGAVQTIRTSLGPAAPAQGEETIGTP